jgi:tetratricopeptide (TPR) repeat protein
METSFARQRRWLTLALLGWQLGPVTVVAQTPAAQGRDAALGTSGRTVANVAAGAQVVPASSVTDAALPPGSQRIDAVYQMATRATSVSQIQQALDDCDRLQTQRLDAANQQYLQQLRAWLLNRRGEAYALSASRLAEAGKSDDAIRWERQAIADFEASLAAQPQWRSYHNRGVSLAMLGDYKAALASFSSAIELNPGYPNTRFNRAELLLELGEYEQAEQEYTDVLKLDPEDVDSRIGRGHARFYMAQFEPALEDFDQVVQRRPENAVAYADRADLYAYLGRWELAARDYRMAVRLDNSLGRAYQSAAWLMATCPDERFRDTQLALKAARRAIELDGTGDYRYLDTLAAAQANASQFGDAAQSAQQALQSAPQDVRAELQQRLALYQAQRPFRDAPH